jgi:YtkA-like protein
MSLCLFCLFVVGFAACRSGSLPDVRIAPELAPQPPRVGQVTITLRVTDASGKPLSGARIRLEGNMSHAGMVPVFADAAEAEPGRYRSHMELSMAGDWIVLVHLTLPDGTKVDRQFEIKGVAPA